MLEREKCNRIAIEMINTDMFVPQDHLLRKIDNAVDFSRIYEFVEDLYCPDNGRPSIDPVVLFKMVLIQHLYGIPSLRKTAEEVRLKHCNLSASRKKAHRTEPPEKAGFSNKARCDTIYVALGVTR